jgi:hypothetical protein
MLLSREGLPFIKDYIDALNESINKIKFGASLSHLQCVWGSVASVASSV